jgi:ESS family glutamate:Na+ symporter
MAETFSGVMTFSFMALMIWVGAILRKNVSFLQESLLPASIIGGIIGFFLISLDFSFSQTGENFVGFAFHFFTLSFMSLALTGSRQKEVGDNNGTRKGTGALWLSVGWTVSLAMQGLVGLLCISLYNFFSEQTLSPSLGVLVTHGFTQGPGQAIAMASIWESQFYIDNAISFGLVYASIGFIVAFMVGIPVAKWALRKGLNENKNARLSKDFLTGFYERDNRPISGSQVTHSSNVDNLVYHLGLLGFAYLATNMILVQAQEALAGYIFLGLPVEVLFSHNLFFVHGLIICLLIRTLINYLKLDYLVDEDTQKHITGSSVDLMIVATLMSIQITFLWNFMLPIILICGSVMVATAILCFGFGRMLPRLRIERSIALFGCCTGSTGSGLLLLRVVDPDLSTSVSRELAYFNVLIIFFSIHILMFVAPLTPSLELTKIIAIYGLTVVFGGALLWRLSSQT